MCYLRDASVSLLSAFDCESCCDLPVSFCAAAFISVKTHLSTSFFKLRLNADPSAGTKSSCLNDGSKKHAVQCKAVTELQYFSSRNLRRLLRKHSLLLNLVDWRRMSVPIGSMTVLQAAVLAP
jgi:hypothetical protein